MQILIAFIVGAVVGIGIHFQLHQRLTRGVVLAPMIGAVSAGAAWSILTWLGVGIDTPWPWLAALIVPMVVTYPAITLTSRARVAHDAREKARLGIG
ncbi:MULTISPECIES: hypothetical protein [Microbacterium]|uniref:Uncharacterized protein n=1 Tax=Microbacterium trichothecenolyticum TaxID=69370 RepID=A0A0M2HJZ7_MICTR|nr:MULTISPECIES: hypothetical protein [Microbacterium]KJL44666.1 hypothetical protein RS82_00622 [Microbacterium trichothecenolyticum]MDR7189462.1 putative membrane protein YeaQ/YmgE (transglycosylase-associated protein family) [Microbacterium sp. BE35]